MTNDLKKIIEDTRSLLEENQDEWKSQYAGYAAKLLDDERLGFIQAANRSFRVKPPLTKNLTISRIKDGKETIEYSLRYQGQEIGSIKVKGEQVTLSSKRFNENNHSHFGCAIAVDNKDWNSTEAIAFRRAFVTTRPERKTKEFGAKKNNREHNLESDLIGEFSKTSSKDKRMTGIQPIKFAKTRFAMRTPISASNTQKINYAKNGMGGGIDILARSGHGAATYLTVIEVKDENTKKEPPKAALKQAIAYAVFIRELLRSDAGENWYKIFGFKRNIPDKLTIRACVAMPRNGENDPDFPKYPLSIGDNGDIIECHYIYFDWESGEISGLTSSLQEKSTL